VKKNADIIADQSEIRLIALENAEAKSDDENKVVIDTFTTIELAESRAELAMVKSELAEVRAELATVKANQSHSDDFAQRNEHRIELDQSQCIHHMKEVELRAELATVKANQSHIRAQLTEHSATLNEQAEIRAEHAELIAALAEIRADHGQILRSSAQLRAEPVEEIAELKTAIKEILTTLKEMISCS
jgi:ribosomal protein L29